MTTNVLGYAAFALSLVSLALHFFKAPAPIETIVDAVLAELNSVKSSTPPSA